MVSVRASFPWLTRARATAPLNAFETLARRVVSALAMARWVATFPTPAVRICGVPPTSMRAMAPGGPPGVATRVRRAAERVADGVVEVDGDDDVEHAASMMAASVAPPSDRQKTIVLPCTRQPYRCPDGRRLLEP